MPSSSGRLTLTLRIASLTGLTVRSIGLSFICFCSVCRLLQSASGYWSNGSGHVDRLVKRQMFIRAWIRLVTQSVSRHRSVIQQHPAAVTGAIGTLLEFITQNSAAPEYANVFQEYLQAATTSSNPVAEDLCLCLRRWMSSWPNPALVETVLKVSVKQNGDLKRVAHVMEAALECYDGTDALLLHLLPADGTSDLILNCWKQEALLAWYHLVRIRGPISINQAPYFLQQLLTDCTSLNLRYLFHSLITKFDLI